MNVYAKRVGSSQLSTLRINDPKIVLHDESIPQNTGEVNNYDPCQVVYPRAIDEPGYPQLIEHSPLWNHIYSHFERYSFEDAEAKYILELKSEANRELPAIASRLAVAA